MRNIVAAAAGHLHRFAAVEDNRAAAAVHSQVQSLAEAGSHLVGQDSLAVVDSQAAVDSRRAAVDSSPAAARLGNQVDSRLEEPHTLRL